MTDNTLKKVHEVEVEILDEVDRICKKYEIKYFLVGGTLLGAVRHKGFIPWDDDIDIAMLREDYEKFMDICLNTDELDDKYFMHCDETDKEYWLPFIKIRKNCTTFNEKFIENYNSHKGIFIDIFPFENLKKQKSFLQKIRVFFVKEIGETIFYKYGFLKKNNCRKKGVVTVLKLMPTNLLKKVRKKLLLMNKTLKTKYIGCMVGAYSFDKEIFKKDSLFPLTEIKFEGKYYPCFKDTNYYLNSLYGDFMKLPPKSQRVTHLPINISFNEGKKLNTKEEKEKYENKKNHT